MDSILSRLRFALFHLPASGAGWRKTIKEKECEYTKVGIYVYLSERMGATRWEKENWSFGTRQRERRIFESISLCWYAMGVELMVAALRLLPLFILHLSSSYFSSHGTNSHSTLLKLYSADGSFPIGSLSLDDPTTRKLVSGLCFKVGQRNRRSYTIDRTIVRGIFERTLEITKGTYGKPLKE